MVVVGGAAVVGVVDIVGAVDVVDVAVVDVAVVEVAGVAVVALRRRVGSDVSCFTPLEQAELMTTTATTTHRPEDDRGARRVPGTARPAISSPKEPKWLCWSRTVAAASIHQSGRHGGGTHFSCEIGRLATRFTGRIAD